MADEIQRESAFPNNPWSAHVRVDFDDRSCPECVEATALAGYPDACPQCQGGLRHVARDVEAETAQRPSGWGHPPLAWRCQDCGRTGTIPPG